MATLDRISPQTLNAIMARHYPLQTAKYTYKRNDYSISNIGRYLHATRQYGQRSIAVDEIMNAARRATRDDFVLPATLSGPNDSVTGEQQQRVSETYLDELECNTTRNCLADVEILDDELPEIIEYEPVVPADDTIRVLPVSEPTTSISDAPPRTADETASVLADEPVPVSSVIFDD